MKKTATVYWLLPAKPERELFCNVIQILRKEFRAPNFEPHLTLFVTTKNRPASAKLRRGRQPESKVLRQIRSRPIRLELRSVAHSPKFTKTLFARFKSSPALRKLTIKLGRAAKFSAKSPADPHVSLLYKKVSGRVRKELATVIKLPVRSVRFDTLAAVRLSLPVRTSADVESWRIVAFKKLTR
jgi:2'-5' RNA ligase